MTGDVWENASASINWHRANPGVDEHADGCVVCERKSLVAALREIDRVAGRNAAETIGPGMNAEVAGAFVEIGIIARAVLSAVREGGAAA